MALVSSSRSLFRERHKDITAWEAHNKWLLVFVLSMLVSLLNVSHHVQQALRSAVCSLSKSLLHHLIVGTRNGQTLYSLDMFDKARRVYSIQARDASGTSPSLVLDVCDHTVQSMRRANGVRNLDSISSAVAQRMRH
jgi:hypothetical protein